MKCKNCKFWTPTTKPYPPSIGDAGSKVWVGVCRRHPPSIEGPSRGTFSIDYHPSTTEKDYCFDFVERSDEGEEAGQ